MRSAYIAAALLLISGIFLQTAQVPVTDGIPPRGTSGTHDSGNFSVIIDDDGGNTAWTTLEYPIGYDRLNTAYFGIGSASDMVDFGKRGDLVTVDPLIINSPGNGTDEEGYCAFAGWPGQDFEDMRIEQRTYVNTYSQDAPGRTGRWMVIDYHLSSNISYDDVYVMQMMDVDLDLPTDDLFAFVEEENMTVTHQGMYFIGLAHYNNGRPHYHGHNAGTMSSSVFDGEAAIFAHMYSPNNQTTSSDMRNWYMDIVVRIPSGTFPGEARVSFAILVGDSIDSLKEALNDARTGMSGIWTSGPPAGWSSGDVPIQASYLGPAYPPISTEVRATAIEGGSGTEIAIPFHFGQDRDLDFTIGTDAMVSDHGLIRYTIDSVDRWGYPFRRSSHVFSCDNMGPSIAFTRPDGWSNEPFTVDASADDRGGSGVDDIQISYNDSPFTSGSSVLISEEGASHQVRAYAIDAAGNAGTLQTASELKLDMTRPVIDSITFFPADIDEDTIGPITVRAAVSDALSGIDQSSGQFRYGLLVPSFDWQPMTWAQGRFEATIEMDWDAAQGSDLYVEVKVSDNAGNLAASFELEHIDPRNDPPDFTMEVISSLWVRDSAIIVFNGSDPDGDEVNFTIEYMMGDGEWTDADSMLSRLSLYRYMFELPRIEYEGPLYIRSTVSDGIENVTIGTAIINMDRKAPGISVVISPPGEWSRESRKIAISAEDAGSGAADMYFIVNGAMRSGRTLNLTDEGVYSITAYCTDAAGNMAEYPLPDIGIDKTPPSIEDMELDPQKLRQGDDLAVSFKCIDALSGVDQVNVSIAPEGSPSIYPGAVVGGGDSYSALFERIQFAPGTAFTVRVMALDAAGNEFMRVSTGHRMEGSLPASINAVIPDSVNVGEDWGITAESDIDIRLHVKYPGTSWDWIITPSRVEGGVRTYNLPAPFWSMEPGPGAGVQYHYPILAWFEMEGSNGTVVIHPDPAFEITILGSLDEDGDGLEDHWEVLHGLDPTRPDDPREDWDRDGLDTRSEMLNLTDPRKRDTDGDGMSDEWEAKMGTLPFREDGHLDYDSDGYTNRVEYYRKTHPRDPESYPDDLPITPWYWMAIIAGILLLIIGFFSFQLINRRKLKEDLDEFSDEDAWGDSD